MANIEELQKKYGVTTDIDGTIPVGWEHIVEEFVQRAITLKTWNKNLGQVKEKFGGLRIYYDEPTDRTEGLKMYEWLEDAEEKSDNTCQECASTNSVMCRDINGLICTLCKECENKTRKRYGR